MVGNQGRYSLIESVLAKPSRTVQRMKASLIDARRITDVVEPCCRDQERSIDGRYSRCHPVGRCGDALNVFPSSRQSHGKPALEIALKQA